jgi:hypothetical protein
MSVPGYETRIEMGNQPTFAASTTWTPFANVVEITPPTLESDDIETSHMLTPQQIRTYMPGWAEPGEIELSIEFNKTEAKRVYDKFRVPGAFRVVFNDKEYPDGSKLMADGYIKSIGHEVDREDRVLIPVVIKVSGATEFVEATA